MTLSEEKKQDGGSLAEEVCDMEFSAIELSDEEFSLFSELIYQTSGIRLGPKRKGLLISRLSKRMKRLGLKSFLEYYKKVKNNSGEMVEMLNCIATNTTKLFREPYHFEYLKKEVIPDLIRTNSQDRTIRIWSAGCSTGEETYSLAITVHDAMNSLQGSEKNKYCSANYNEWDIKILGTDISTKVLETANSGIYELEQIPDDMTTDTLVRYFLKGTGANEGKIMPKSFIKDMIRFRRLNLKDSNYPLKRKFDVIFCRNVMIYFDEGMKRHVLSMFYNCLSDNGYLFLGHSETMFNREQFLPVYITVYKKAHNAFM